MRPLISVVMATYNGEPFLRTAIQSVLLQSFRDFELIIVDDGSTDNSRNVIRQHARIDSRIRSVSKKHSGLVASLNQACALARGEFLARLDSDDIAMPMRFEKQITYLQANPTVALLGSAIECIDEKGKPLFIMRWPCQAEGLQDHLLLDCAISHTTVLFRRDLFLSLGGYRSQFQHAEDYDLFLRMGDNNVLDNHPEVLCQYRLHQKQVSARSISQQVVSGIGARLATKARRSNRPEPTMQNPISKKDLVSLGITLERINGLIQCYKASADDYSSGWRWSRKPFLLLSSL